MPTYHYRCNDCSDEFDIQQSMMDDALTDCKKCKGTIRRVIGGNVGIAFKGSGFYINDKGDSSKKD